MNYEHWADRNAALYKSGWSPTTVARKLGVEPTAVSQVIREKATSYNIASFVSAVTDIPLKRLFPDGRYSPPHPRRSSARRAAT